MDAARKLPITDSLDALPDDDVRFVIEHLRGLLAARANDRRRHATAEIKRIAKEAGLNIAVKHPARKRGRPRKSEPAAL